ncbi:MAG: AAA family ATPase, partial [Victivallales bacterium]|nr:AAA family ATPase [Victivallales bacterium]
ITGIRRCGKSYMLRTLFRNYLPERGMESEQTIHPELDSVRNIRYRIPASPAHFIPWKPATFFGGFQCKKRR